MCILVPFRLKNTHFCCKVLGSRCIESRLSIYVTEFCNSVWSAVVQLRVDDILLVVHVALNKKSSVDENYCK